MYYLWLPALVFGKLSYGYGEPCDSDDTCWTLVNCSMCAGQFREVPVCTCQDRIHVDLIKDRPEQFHDLLMNMKGTSDKQCLCPDVFGEVRHVK